MDDVTQLDDKKFAALAKSFRHQAMGYFRKRLPLPAILAESIKLVEAEEKRRGGFLDKGPGSEADNAITTRPIRDLLQDNGVDDVENAVRAFKAFLMDAGHDRRMKSRPGEQVVISRLLELLD